MFIFQCLNYSCRESKDKKKYPNDSKSIDDKLLARFRYRKFLEKNLKKK